jgi:hypothetical protein
VRLYVRHFVALGHEARQDIRDIRRRIVGKAELLDLKAATDAANAIPAVGHDPTGFRLAESIVVPDRKRATQGF